MPIYSVNGDTLDANTYFVDRRPDDPSFRTAA